jgi:hypothetical protein
MASPPLPYDFQITIFGDDRHRAQTGVNQITTPPFFSPTDSQCTIDTQTIFLNLIFQLIGIPCFEMENRVCV